jgi:hypothetical protein
LEIGRSKNRKELLNRNKTTRTGNRRWAVAKTEKISKHKHDKPQTKNRRFLEEKNREEN